MEISAIAINEDKTKDIYASSDCQLLIHSMNEFYHEIGFHFPWVGYFVIKDGHVVGTGGFTGPPQEGCVEIAYWTFKEFENQGVASFTCQALVALATQTDPTLTVTAKTKPEYNASTKILQKNGFEFAEIVQDHRYSFAYQAKK
jgi:[ribosomal protein S5]-alanine N-acetyltransferase